MSQCTYAEYMLIPEAWCCSHHHFLCCFLLFIFSVPEELDPTRVCKGKGAVTLRATLVHVDDGDCITQEQDVNPAKSEWKVSAHIALKA